MIHVHTAYPLQHADLGTYLAQRYPVRRRLDACVIGDTVGVIIRPTSHGVSILPTILSPGKILACVLLVGLLAWFLIWQHEANQLADLIARDLKRHF